MKLELRLEDIMPLPTTDEEIYSLKRIDSVALEVKARNWGKVHELLVDAENDPKINQEYKDFFLSKSRIQLLALSNDKYRDYEKAEHLILEYLDKYRPGFDLERVADYFLTNGEATQLSHLATIYSNGDEPQKGIAILEQLVAFVERWYILSVSTVMQFNYMAYLGKLGVSYLLAGALEKALEVNTKAIEVARKNMNVDMIQSYQSDRAVILLDMGRLDEAKHCLKKYLMIQYGTEHMRSWDNYEDGITFPEFVQRDYGIDCLELVEPIE